MKSIVIHPIEDNPLIQAYQYRNFELSVLCAQNRNIMPWFFNKLINCYYKEDALSSPFCHITYNEKWYEDEGVMTVNRMRFQKSISEIDCINIMSIAKEMIASGYYFMGYFDEYFIRCKSAYNSFHFRHNALIYGYNDNEKYFYAIGYTAARKYERYRFPYDEFISSLAVDYDITKEYRRIYIERVEYNFVKVNDSFPFEINIDEIYSNLYDYIHSIDSKATKEPNVSYGIDSEKHFIRYMESVGAEDKRADLRFSRFYMELKNIMRLRLDYLEQNGYINPGIAADYEKINEAQEAIHNLFKKYNLTHKEPIIAKTVQLQRDIIREETIILPLLLDELRAYLNSRQIEKYK